MDDSLAVTCTKCKSKFRDRARRVQNGYSRQCPYCEVLMFFEELSPDKNIRKALNDARRLRSALHKEAADKAANAGGGKQDGTATLGTHRLNRRSTMVGRH
jgi:DNA-directed RNA polymerase subunit RPC12/RpoP